MTRTVSAWLAALTRKTAAVRHSRRGFVVAGAIMAAAALLPSAGISAQDAWNTQHWVGTWGTAPAGPPLAGALQTFNDQTLRLIVHTSIGGTQVRIRVSNELGTAPLRIGAAQVALRRSGADVVPASSRVLTFSGSASIVIPPGAPALSDPVALDVPALSDLAVSLYLSGETTAETIHGSAFQTNYVSLPGNFVGAETLPTQRTITSWPFLTEVDVHSPGGGAIVALGDSITDGSVTTLDANNRWPDLLSQRLRTTREPIAPSGSGRVRPAVAQRGVDTRLGIVNRGIGGNRLLRDPGNQPLFGKAALARFDRDVLASAGVEYLLVLIGINDIGHPGSGSAPASEAVTAQEVIAGYRQLIARAHVKGIPVFGATLTPFEGTVFPGYYTPEKEQVRQAVNAWIRGSDEFDAVIDFERALRDPDHPTRMLPAFDSGDHLHPNDLGMQAMANAIPLELFRRFGLVKSKAK